AVHPFRQSSKEKLSGPTVLCPETSTRAPAQPAFAYTSHCPAATPRRPVTVAILLTSVLYVSVGDLRLRKSSLSASPLGVLSTPRRPPRSGCLWRFWPPPMNPRASLLPRSPVRLMFAQSTVDHAPPMWPPT